MTEYKIGIIPLGRAAGKTKYALLDEEDFHLTSNYAFEARTVVDPDGNGAAVMAWAFNLHVGRGSGQYLHNIIWTLHCGGVPPGYRVIHKNSICVDNRLSNLTLVSVKRLGDLDMPIVKNKEQNSVYWAAMLQVPFDPLQEVYHYPESLGSRYYCANGEHTSREDECTLFYECHYRPCTNMEQELRQFSICGRCHSIRYCGPSCQELDWQVHKKFCLERRPAFADDEPFDR